jgi:hypothetical protein
MARDDAAAVTHGDRADRGQGMIDFVRGVQHGADACRRSA